MEDTVLGVLLDVQKTTGDIRDRMGRIEGQFSQLPCSVHTNAIATAAASAAAAVSAATTAVAAAKSAVETNSALAQRVEDIDAKLDNIRLNDLPALRTQIALLDWWKRGRNKMLAAILIAALSVGGSLLGDALKGALSAAKSAPAITAPVPPPVPDQDVLMP